MTELDKVIAGLKCCKDMHTAGSGYAQSCIECPYKDATPDGMMGFACIRELFRKNIALLEAQEPRLMTLEEVKAIQPDTDVWMEVVPLHGPIKVRAYTVSGFTPGGGRLCVIGGGHNYPVDTYNQYFRCWTSRPTDEQREMEPWRT